MQKFNKLKRFKYCKRIYGEVLLEKAIFKHFALFYFSENWENKVLKLGERFALNISDRITFNTFNRI